MMIVYESDDGNFCRHRETLFVSVKDDVGYLLRNLFLKMIVLIPLTYFSLIFQNCYSSKMQMKVIHNDNNLRIVFMCLRVFQRVQLLLQRSRRRQSLQLAK